MDAAGRIVLPKKLRDRLHLTAGSELALTQKDRQIVMSPIEPKSRLMRKEGLWVITGLPRRDINWNRLIEEDREERTRHLAGEK